MATVALEGTGATIAFGTSGFTADLISLTLPEFTREAIESTHLGTTGAKTFKSAKLYTVGDISATFDHDPSETDMITQDAETITISYPLLDGQATPTTLEFTGFAMSVGGEEMTVDSRMVTSMTIKPQGAITKTPATLAS
jgi:hypothetical protein